MEEKLDPSCVARLEDQERLNKHKKIKISDEWEELFADPKKIEKLAERINKQ